MKLWSKEALIIGGFYGILETPLSFLGMDNVTDILFLLFIVLIFALCFGKTPKFLSTFIHKYPRISYYLISIGWIPYFLMVAVAIILGIGFLSGSLEHLQEHVLYGTAYLGLGLALLSLIVAFIKKRKYFRSKAS